MPGRERVRTNPASAGDRSRPTKVVATATRILAGLGSLAFAAAAATALRAGVPVYDPWLFPTLVLCPAAVSAGLGLLVFAPTGWRLNVLLAGVSVLIGLYSVEAVLEVVSPVGTGETAAVEDEGGRTVDTRTRLQVAMDLRESGTEAWPLIGGRALRSSPPLGPGVIVNGRPVAPLAQLPNSTIVGCNESGEYPLLQTDEDGFNNPPGSWHRPITVALVGDSYVEGSCIDPADGLVAGLQRHIPGTIAVGLSDSGPLVMLGLIKEYLTRVRPDDVFWFFYEGNDLANLVAEMQAPGLRIYLEPEGTQDLLAIRDSVEPGIRAYLSGLMQRPAREGRREPASDPARNRLSNWMRLSRLRQTLALANVSSRLQNCCDLPDFEVVLEEADRSVRDWGGRLHFVYLPAAGRYYHPMSALLDDNVRYRAPVLRLVHRLGLPVVDIHDAFEAAGDPRDLFFNDRSHYNEAGYALVVEAVYRHLQEAGRDSAVSPPHD